jgi:hypothetical protein
MRAYRVYILGDGGKVTESIDLADCFNDETAKTRASRSCRHRRRRPAQSSDYAGGRKLGHATF